MDPRLAATIRSYERNADLYASTTLSYHRYPGLRETVEQFESMAPASLPVLDAGCGAGRDSLLLAQLGRTVISLDASDRLLRVWPIQTSNKASPFRVRGDLGAPPLLDSTLAGIWACASLLHQPSDELSRVLAGLVRLLVPGGLLMVTWRPVDGDASEGYVEKDGMQARWENCVLPAAASAALSHAGLGEIGWRPTGGDWYAVWGVSPVVD